MPPSYQNKVTPRESADTASACGTALAETCKALKAFSFYPENHPLRDRILHAAFQAMTALVKDGALSLLVQRNGFVLAEEEIALANTPMTLALAQELFTRELQRLTVQPDLTLSDFAAFLSLLATDPQKLSAAGGLPRVLKEQGISTITANEIDISAVFTKKKVALATEDTVAQGSVVEEAPEPVTAHTESKAPPHPREQQVEELTVEELLERMAAESDDGRYRQLSRMLLAKAQPLQREERFQQLYVILAALAHQHTDAARSEAQRGSAVALLQQLAFGKAAEWLLDRLDDDSFEGKEPLFLVLTLAGAELVDPIIARLISARRKAAREALTTLLATIGPSALPALTALLKDERVAVVATAVAALGEMGNRDAVKSLSLTLLHPDDRIRMETVRALARIGGMEGTTLLLDLLHGQDQPLAMQAITWLGNTRNSRALQPLLQLVLKRDLRGKAQQVKKHALRAIGRIGDRRALEELARLVQKRYWLAPARWNELKLIAIEAIGAIGGEAAREFLQEVAARGGVLGQAASSAVATMAQRTTAGNE